jgi:hypothetical protein
MPAETSLNVHFEIFGPKIKHRFENHAHCDLINIHGRLVGKRPFIFVTDGLIDNFHFNQQIQNSLRKPRRNTVHGGNIQGRKGSLSVFEAFTYDACDHENSEITVAVADVFDLLFEKEVLYVLGGKSDFGSKKNHNPCQLQP